MSENRFCGCQTLSRLGLAEANREVEQSCFPYAVRCLTFELPL